MHYFAPTEFMRTFEHIVALTAPLFILVLLGYGMTRWAGWPKPVSDALTRFVFSVGIPALLFRLMSDFSRLPPVDPRLLIAFFGSCFVVFALGRFIASRLFHMDGVSQSVFALGGIFAGGLAVHRCFLKATDIPARSLESPLGLSLWSPGSDWQKPVSPAPLMCNLPNRFWVLGLGHLAARLNGEPGIVFAQAPFLSDQDIELAVDAIIQGDEAARLETAERESKLV